MVRYRQASQWRPSAQLTEMCVYCVVKLYIDIDTFGIDGSLRHAAELQVAR